jgi:PAS domain S-box-containing protein
MAARAGGEVEQTPSAIFKLLVESVSDYAIFLLDPDGRVRTWNAGARRIKGYEATEIVGRSFALFYTPEDVRDDKPGRALREATAVGRWVDEGWRVRKDGSRFWASVVLTALRDDAGELVGIAKVTRDLTERRLAEEERARLLAEERAARAATEAAEEALRARDTFLSIAAHELRTPLTALKGTTQLLLRRARRGAIESERLIGALATVDRSADRNELLDVARIHAGQLPLTLRPLDLAALLAEIVAQARYRTGGDRVRLSAAALPAVAADAGRLEQVLVNLLDNAIKYSPAGGEVTVTARAEDGGVAIAVTDSGIGLPPEAAESIFSPFGRATNAAASGLPGLGLGLFICRGIVEQHGGWIRATSPGEGQGTTVTCWLPGTDQA